MTTVSAVPWNRRIRPQPELCSSGSSPIPPPPPPPPAVARAGIRPPPTAAAAAGGCTARSRSRAFRGGTKGDRRLRPRPPTPRPHTPRGNAPRPGPDPRRCGLHVSRSPPPLLPPRTRRTPGGGLCHAGPARGAPLAPRRRRRRRRPRAAVLGPAAAPRPGPAPGRARLLPPGRGCGSPAARRRG